MNIQKISDAMPRSMLIIQSMLPQHFSCPNIQICSAAAIPESGCTQIQHGTKYKRIMEFHLFRDLSKHKRPCNVCRPIQIVSATVHHQHSFRFQTGTASFLCLIMDNRSMFSIRTNRRKTQFKKAFLTGTQPVKIMCSRNLIHLYSADILFQPVHKSGYRNSILQMCFPNM